MDELTSKKELLERIRLSEGDEFECDEKAVLKEYSRNKENQSSIAIKVLSIFGGFLATLSFLGFLGISGLYSSKMGLVIFGSGFIIAAIGLNKLYDQLIIDTFSISIYISGFALLAFGLSGMDVDENLVVLLTSALAISSLMITQKNVLSFISVLVVSVSSITLIISNDSYSFIHLYIIVCSLLLVYIFLNEAKLISMNKELSRLYSPLRIGMVFSLLFGLIAVGKRQLIPISQEYIWISSIVLILLIGYLVRIVIRINEIKSSKNKGLVYLLSALILFSIVLSPAILGSFLIILLSFLVHYKTGFTIGIISLIYFIAQYYYDLNYTLLTKSVILLVSGIVFILLYLITTKKGNLDEKT
jgi:hypothetical protein